MRKSDINASVGRRRARGHIGQAGAAEREHDPQPISPTNFHANQFDQPILSANQFNRRGQMVEKKSKTVRVALTLDVDVSAWCLEYGVEANEVPLDVANYVNTVLHELRAVEDGLFTIREDNPEPHPFTDGGIRVSTHQLSVVWATMRKLRADIVAGAAQPADAASPVLGIKRLELGVMTLMYGQMVGIPHLHVQQYLSLFDRTTPPTQPLKMVGPVT